MAGTRTRFLRLSGIGHIHKFWEMFQINTLQKNDTIMFMGPQGLTQNRTIIMLIRQMFYMSGIDLT